jgi:hypothetical protein
MQIQRWGGTMATKRLSFADVKILEESVAEIIVDEGVEVSIPMVNELHAYLLANLKAPFATLVNKIHQYSYSGEAQFKLGDLPELVAIAVISYSPITHTTTGHLATLPRKNQWNLKMFSERSEALHWLRGKLAEK